ncbi:Uu.00g116970.m01.CDS01 [Anthostomella pinea]|uniref:Uu.00g116970.m01.CDS01 n=1 Tax=Anthostomella pinea TaxID=933095 RepID=A0AAI8YEG7_9PEZI|nr:Uu.00g116970.m01.CDS01 [Anthostomella pinea]
MAIGAGTTVPGVVSEAGTWHAKKSSLETNFSYPRLVHHESSESRSSITSNGSVPGMTDSSDSDLSFDDDCHYNASASELWDSFWPESTLAPQEQYPAVLRASVLRASRSRDCFNVIPSRHQPRDTDDDTIRIGQWEQYVTKPAERPHSRSGSPSSPPRPASSRRAPAPAVSYSVYPKPSLSDIRRAALPPRSSSLNTEQQQPPPSPPRRVPFLRTSKSSVALKSSMALKPSKSSHNLRPLYIAQPRLLPSSKPSPSFYLAESKSRLPENNTAAATKSVPVSPAYPPPPAPRSLRPSKSAFNIRANRPTYTRQNSSGQQHSHIAHQAAIPLTPLIPSTLLKPEADSSPSRAPRPQVERFVSVFEFDSEGESEAGGGENGNGTTGGLAKRIARGLHHHKKKSSTDRSRPGLVRANSSPGPVIVAAVDKDNREKVVGEKERDKSPERSLGRKRGGSLVRIFGLKGR